MASKKITTKARFRCAGVCSCGKPCRKWERVTVSTDLPTTKAGWLAILADAAPAVIRAAKAALS